MLLHRLYAMRRVTAIQLKIASLCILAGVSVSAASTEEIAAVEKQSLNSRLAIASYHVRVHYKNPVNGLGSNWKSADYYREGEFVRLDFARFYSDEQKFPGLINETYDTRKIFAPTHTYVFGTQQFPGNQAEAVQVSRIAEEVSAKYSDAVKADIRSVGFHPCGAWVIFPVDDLLRNYGSVERAMEDDQINGISCKKISLQAAPGSECSIWIAPERGYSPIRCVANVAKLNMSDQTDVEVVEWNKSGLWFPTASKYVRTIAGKVVHQEEALFEIVSLNQPLPPQTFELAGLDIPVGHAVYTVPDSGPLQLWDGEKVATAGMRKREAQAEIDAGAPGTRWFLIVNASVLAFVCVFFFIRFFQSRLSAGRAK